jgi:hypothetical protein
LELLHRLLTMQIQTVGQWNLLRQSGAVSSLLDDSERALVRARCVIAAELVELARIGRGRPADRRALEASGAVSGAYIDGASEILAELDGDAGQLMQILRDRSDARVAGFRSNKLDQLREYLEAEGHLDPREPLACRQAVTELLATPAVGRLISAEGMAPEDAPAQAQRLWASLT